MIPSPTKPPAAGVIADTGVLALDQGADEAALIGDEAKDANVADAVVVAAVRAGETERFEELVRRHSPRLFAVVRKYARREDEVADLVQDVFLKAYRRLNLWRGEAPFGHWLMRMAVNTCYDYLRAERRHPVELLSQISEDEQAWLDRHAAAPETTSPDADGARTLVQKILSQLSPASRLVIQLLEIEERSLKEISAMTGWSVVLVKVRAFRARAEMRKLVQRIDVRKYL